MTQGQKHSGVLRISGGSLGGRTIPVPPGTIRPAMDKMRESVFAILGELNGKSFLDLFSGSGIIALEAASRGASYIEAVESDPLKRKTLITNAALSPIRINCRFMPVELYIRRYKKPAFDYIFCDPPFPYKYKDELLLSIASSALVKTGTVILIHRPKPALPSPFDKKIILRETRIYGGSVVDFYITK